MSYTFSNNINIYNSNGQPITVDERLPVDIGNTSINISGNVNVNFPNVVTVNSSSDNPVHVHITEIGTTNLMSYTYMPIGGNVFITSGSVTVNGTINVASISSNVIVSVNNFPNNWMYFSNGAAVSNSAPVPITGNIVATVSGNVTTVPIAGGLDAFGRLRVSEEFTLGDYKHTYALDPNFINSTANGATITYITNQAAARLTTTSNATSYAIHQTKQYHNYMPGKSQFIKTTINFYAATPNVTKRTGYFDDQNGIFFEQTGDGTLAFVIRTNTSGSPSDARRVTQAQWNQDTCNTSIVGTSIDGSNYSKAGSFNLDITKTQIFWIDFQWLGVGRVRCGFVIDGYYVVAHEFYNSNHLPVVYMSNPNLPVRCEIRNTGTTTGAYYDQICSTVISEGGYVESGIDWAITTGQTGQSVATSSNNYPLIALRLKTTFKSYPNRVTVRMGNINIYAEDYPAYWKLIKLPDSSYITLANSTWTSVSSDSAVEYNLSGTGISGGDEMDDGLVGTSSPGGSAKGTGVAPINQPSTAKKNFIAQNIDSSNSEIYVIAIQAIGGTTTAWAGIQWREIY